jgi:hypothetical protein
MPAPTCCRVPVWVSSSLGPFVLEEAVLICSFFYHFRVAAVEAKLIGTGCRRSPGYVIARFKTKNVLVFASALAPGLGLLPVAATSVSGAPGADSWIVLSLAHLPCLCIAGWASAARCI